MLANGWWGGHFVRRSPPSGTPLSHNGINGNGEVEAFYDSF